MPTKDSAKLRYSRFVYEKNGYTIPIIAVYNSLTTLQQEALDAAVEAYIAAQIAEVELNVLEKLEANSDCAEDQCGLDAELLRDNLLKRISELRAHLTTGQKEVS